MSSNEEVDNYAGIEFLRDALAYLDSRVEERNNDKSVSQLLNEAAEIQRQFPPTKSNIPWPEVKAGEKSPSQTQHAPETGWADFEIFEVNYPDNIQVLIDRDEEGEIDVRVWNIGDDNPLDTHTFYLPSKTDCKKCGDRVGRDYLDDQGLCSVCEIEAVESDLFPTAEDKAMIAKIDALGAGLSDSLESTLPGDAIPYDASPRYISLDDTDEHPEWCGEDHQCEEHESAAIDREMDRAEAEGVE